MPHCQKEFSKPPVSSKAKKEQQKAKKDADKAKAAKRAQEEEEEENARKQQEQDPAEREAELAREQETRQREERARQLKDAKKKGGEAFKANNLVEALSCYSECIELDPEDHIHWSNRSAVNNLLGNFEEALEDGAKCVEINSEFAKGWARVGAANFALERYDAAQEAFERGLALEPDNTACTDGLSNIEKAKEPTEEDIFEKLVKDLKKMDVEQLRARALEEGLSEDRVCAAESENDPRVSLGNLITAHKYLVELINGELKEMNLEQLKAKALEEGLADEKVAEVEGLDDAVEALKAIIVKHMSNDLVDAAAELQAEAAEECDEESDEETGGDLDFEIVYDDSDLQLEKGDVFLAGAYIDDKYGELVLPSGTRLGNRGLKMFYKQRARPTNDRQLAMQKRLGAAAMHHLQAKVMRREEMKRENGILARSHQLSKGNCNAIASQTFHKQKDADNELNRAIVHHWGAGGGGSHYHSCGGKQYIKGNKIKGVVLRHSRQGAKLQAARNKANRGNRSVACLQ